MKENFMMTLVPVRNFSADAFKFTATIVINPKATEALTKAFQKLTIKKTKQHKDRCTNP